MHSPSLEGNCYDKHGKAVKPAITQYCNRHKYVGKSDHITNSSSISQRTWKWTKKLFFHLLDLTILNSFIILTRCGSKLSHQQFTLTLVRDLIQQTRRVPRLQAAWQIKQAPSMSQHQRLHSRHNRHWFMQCKRIPCVCSAKNKETRTKYKCQKQHRVVCYPMFPGISHHTAFLWTNLQQTGEVEHTIVINITTVITALIICSSIFLMKWGWRGCGFYRRGFMK